jgi:hypothetical protein
MRVTAIEGPRVRLSRQHPGGASAVLVLVTEGRRIALAKVREYARENENPARFERATLLLEVVRQYEWLAERAEAQERGSKKP